MRSSQASDGAEALKTDCQGSYMSAAGTGWLDPANAGKPIEQLKLESYAVGHSPRPYPPLRVDYTRNSCHEPRRALDSALILQVPTSLGERIGCERSCFPESKMAKGGKEKEANDSEITPAAEVSPELGSCSQSHAYSRAKRATHQPVPGLKRADLFVGVLAWYCRPARQS